MPNGSDQSPACTTFLADHEGSRPGLRLRGLQGAPCVRWPGAIWIRRLASVHSFSTTRRPEWLCICLCDDLGYFSVRSILTILSKIADSSPPCSNPPDLFTLLYSFFFTALNILPTINFTHLLYIIMYCVLLH